MGKLILIMLLGCGVLACAMTEDKDIEQAKLKGFFGGVLFVGVVMVLSW